MHILATGVAHERLAHLLHHAGFEQATIEAVAKVMEAVVADVGPPQRPLPARFDPMKGLLFEGEDRTGFLFVREKPVEDTLGERQLAGLPFRSFGMGHEQKPSGKVHILPELVEDLAAPHAGIQGGDDDRSQMRGCGLKQKPLLLYADDRALLLAFAFKRNPG